MEVRRDSASEVKVGACPKPEKPVLARVRRFRHHSKVEVVNS
jgi:hypothetical protein